MSEINRELNIIELLMGIKEDVSSIKTDMANFKEAQRLEKENTVKEIADVRADYKRELVELESRYSGKLNNMQSILNNLVGEVEELKNRDDKKDADKWRRVTTYLITGIAGLALGNISSIIKLLYSLFGGK